MVVATTYNWSLEPKQEGTMDFDWSEIGKVLPYLIPVIMFILFSVLFKKQRKQQRRLAVVKSLFIEVTNLVSTV